MRSGAVCLGHHTVCPREGHWQGMARWRGWRAEGNAGSNGMLASWSVEIQQRALPAAKFVISSS